jgi:hypothetical protein
MMTKCKYCGQTIHTCDWCGARGYAFIKTTPPPGMEKFSTAPITLATVCKVHLEEFSFNEYTVIGTEHEKRDTET